MWRCRPYIIITCCCCLNSHRCKCTIFMYTALFYFLSCSILSLIIHISICSLFLAWMTTTLISNKQAWYLDLHVMFWTTDCTKMMWIGNPGLWAIAVDIFQFFLTYLIINSIGQEINFVSCSFTVRSHQAQIKWFTRFVSVNLSARIFCLLASFALITECIFTCTRVPEWRKFWWEGMDLVELDYTTMAAALYLL